MKKILFCLVFICSGFSLVFSSTGQGMTTPPRQGLGVFDMNSHSLSVGRSSDSYSRTPMVSQHSVASAVRSSTDPRRNRKEKRDEHVAAVRKLDYSDEEDAGSVISENVAFRHSSPLDSRRDREISLDLIVKLSNLKTQFGAVLAEMEKFSYACSSDPDVQALVHFISRQAEQLVRSVQPRRERSDCADDIDYGAIRPDSPGWDHTARVLSFEEEKI